MRYLVKMALIIYVIIAFAGCCCEPPHEQIMGSHMNKFSFLLHYNALDLPKNDLIEKIKQEGYNTPQSVDVKDDIHTFVFRVDTTENNPLESIAFTFYYTKSNTADVSNIYLDKLNIRLNSQEYHSDLKELLWESTISFYDHDMADSTTYYPLDQHERLYDGSTKHTHYTYTYGYQDFTTTQEYDLSQRSIKPPNETGVGAQWAKEELQRWLLSNENVMPKRP